MSATKLASRYAKSLLGLAIEQGQLQSIYGDIATINDALNNKEFYLLIKSPIVSPDQKLTILQALFADTLNRVTKSFIDIIVKKRREFYLPEIVDSFIAQYKAHKGIASAEVISAEPLGDSLLGDIKDIVIKATGKKQVDLTTKIDKDLIGGFILSFEDKLYDASIAHKLDKLQKQFSDNQYVRKF